MIEFRLFGTASLEGAQRSTSLLSRPRDVALLAYLAAARPAGFHTRDALLALLWPESSERRARNALNQALHRLRRSLGDALVSRGPHLVGLDSAQLASDVDRFRTAIARNRPEAALAEYQGDLLAGFHVAAAAAFDHWLEEERNRLRGAAQDAARTLRDQAAAAGNLDTALRWARRAAELWRNESDVLRLSEIHADAGDPVAALRASEAFERWLRDELELEPSAAFRAAAEALRASRPAGRPAPGTGTVEPRRSRVATPVTPRRKRRAVVGGTLIALLVAGAAWSAAGFPGVAARGRSLTSSVEAADFYARGREYWRLGVDVDPGTNWELAVEMFDSAVARDPGFAAAHGELGIAHLRLFHWGFDRSAARQQLAERSIGRALVLDPDLTETRIALGYYHLWASRDYARALAAGQRALEERPDDVEALSLVVRADRGLGNAAEAVAPLGELVQLQPRTSLWRRELVATLIGLRRYQQARRELDRAVALFPAEPGFYVLRWQLTLRETGDVEAAGRALTGAARRVPRGDLWPLDFEQRWLSRNYGAALRVLERVGPKTFRTQQGELPVELMYGLVHRLAGDSAEARRFYRAALPALRQKLALKPDEKWIHAWLAIGLAGAGDAEGAVREARRFEELAAAEPDAWENPSLRQHLVEAYIMSGELETAITMIEDLLGSEHLLAISVPWLRIDPRLDPLRTNPRFRRIVADG